ncbi:MAG: zinc ABC transporter substrate-binding protein [Simkaniaceae bacterium]|nr:zinc ABC transporter substrate-binding protein [Candidatus Sacchlamyda saccharinae]
MRNILRILVLLPLCFGCNKKEQPSKPTVLVTIAPYAYVVERIAKDTVALETLVPAGMNIHTYEPSPKLVEAAIDSRVWFRIGEPFEKKIVKTIAERNPEQKIVNLQDGIDLLSSHDAIELAPCIGHDHGTHDLHTWLSPKRFLKQAQVIAETLIVLFPEHKATYEKNFNDLALDLQTLDRDLKKDLAPYKGEALLVSHPAFGYYCADYGLIQLSVECEGKDPRPKDIEDILEKTKIYTVRSVFLQQGFNNRGAQLIGKKLQLPIYRIEPYAYDYLTNMRQITGHITK